MRIELEILNAKKEIVSGKITGNVIKNNIGEYRNEEPLLWDNISPEGYVSYVRIHHPDTGFQDVPLDVS